MGSILLIGAGSSSSDSSGLASSPPTITSSATFSMAENTTAVGTVTATGGQTPYTFSISGGADSALFTINSSTGVLAFLVAPDFTDPQDADTDNVYEVTVRVASVGGAYSDQAVEVTVTYDPAAHFDVAFLIADPAYCFTNAAGTTAAGEGDPILCWTATNGKKFTKASASGFTLQKANGLWVVRADGSGYLRATTGGTAMGAGFTMTTIYRSTTLGGFYGPLGFGDTSGNGRRRMILIYSDNHIAFNGDSADFGTGTAVDDTWTDFLVGIDGSNNGNCYQDGASAGSGTPSLNSYTNDTITIGGSNSGGDLFIGEYSRIGFQSSKIDATRRSLWDTYAAGIVSALSAIFMLSSPIIAGAISASSIMG